MHGKIAQASLFQKRYGFLLGAPFFDEVFSRFLLSRIKKRDFFLEKECFEVFARNFR